MENELTYEQALEAAKWALPEVGSVWTWEPDLHHARCRIIVTEVHWNGEAWWVRTALENGRAAYWNDLMRFIEACVMVSPDTTDRTWQPA